MISFDGLGSRMSDKRLSAIRTQRRVLHKLLDTSAGTRFGQQYKFSDILSGDDITELFAKNVPVHSYADMSLWWEEARQGRSDVCWKGTIRHFALSSGTSEGSSKYVPVSKEMLRAIKRAGTRQYFALLKEKEVPVSVFNGSSLMMGSSSDLQYYGTHYQGDLSGIITSRIPLWFQAFAKPDIETRKMPWKDKINSIAEQAPDWDITMIGGVPAWITMLFQEITARYGVKSIHDIWPNLKVYFHGGVAITPYLSTLQTYFSQEVFLFETYLASEGFFAYQSRLRAAGMKLIVNNGIYYEFIPFTNEFFDADGNLLTRYPKTLTLSQVKDKEEYALIVSTCAGAWRYLIGDTVRFESLSHMEMVITGRTKHFLSLCGEHLSVDNMNEALRYVSEIFQVKCMEYCVAGVKTAEGFAHEWYIGTDREVDVAAFSAALDNQLKQINDDYRTERDFALKAIKVSLLPNNFFTDYLATIGKQGGQVKFPRVLKGGQYTQWIEYVEAQSKKNKDFL